MFSNFKNPCKKSAFAGNFLIAWLKSWKGCCARVLISTLLWFLATFCARATHVVLIAIHHCVGVATYSRNTYLRLTLPGNMMTLELITTKY